MALAVQEKPTAVAVIAGTSSHASQAPQALKHSGCSEGIATLKNLQAQYAHLNRENLAMWQEHIISHQAQALVEEDTVGPYRQWSPSAVACFVRNANCSGCYYQNFFSDSPHGCQMNEAVEHLLKKLGPPNKRHIAKVS